MKRGNRVLKLRKNTGALEEKRQHMWGNKLQALVWSMNRNTWIRLGLGLHLKPGYLQNNKTQTISDLQGLLQGTKWWTKLKQTFLLTWQRGVAQSWLSEWVQVAEINGSQMTRLPEYEKYPVLKWEITKQHLSDGLINENSQSSRIKEI